MKYPNKKSMIIIDKKRKIVTKKFRNPHEYAKELFIYQKSLSFTPALIESNYNQITIEWINSKTVGEIENPDPDKIATLFSKLHRIKDKNGTICLVDTNPRNILVDIESNFYYLIDFSTWEFNYPETDLINVLLFFASMFAFEKFRQFSYSFLKSYSELLPIDFEQFHKLLPEKNEIFDLRRKKYGKIEKSGRSDKKKNRDLLFKIKGETNFY